MKRLSEQLDELSVRVKRTEDVLDAAQQRNRARLEQQQAALRSAVAEGSEKLAAGGQHAEDDWNDARSAVHKRFDTLRSKADDRHAEHEEKRAERRAERAEQDATDAIDFAVYVLDQAEWAVVDAVLTRADADELTATP